MEKLDSLSVPSGAKENSVQDKEDSETDQKGKDNQEIISDEPVGPVEVNWNKPYEEMEVPELQEAVLAKLGQNGPVTDQMKREVRENVYKDSLINWAKSFR